MQIASSSAAHLPERAQLLPVCLQTFHANSVPLERNLLTHLWSSEMSRLVLML